VGVQGHFVQRQNAKAGPSSPPRQRGPVDSLGSHCPGLRPGSGDASVGWDITLGASLGRKEINPSPTIINWG